MQSESSVPEASTYKTHRRLSSVFHPPSQPITTKTIESARNAVAPIRRKFIHSATSRNDCRRIIPNCFWTLPRYELPNFKLYCGNKVKTTKYTLLTFIPRNLWEQFHRIANLYFIMIACLNFVPILKTFNRYIALFPVVLVLSLTAIKDAYEDFRRRRLDKKVNSMMCHLWDRSKGRFRKTLWKHLIVGDFVHLSADETIPADLLLVRSSDSRGICFVETSNLDGETSLKLRKVPFSMVQYSSDSKQFSQEDFDIIVECERPNKTMNQMSGHVRYKNGTAEGVSRDNLLLRGSKVRNTTFVEGLILYAGSETKAMMNNSGPRYKRSSLEVITNRYIICCIITLIAMCLFDGICSIIWLRSMAYFSSAPFMMVHVYPPLIQGAVNVISSMLNYQILVPLSLYISVELIKLGQAFFISQDMDLYSEEKDRATECRSLNIPEELGQIQYILSDKTGTLTENQMIFRKCSVNGISYGDDMDIKSLKNSCKTEDVVISPSLKQYVVSHWDSDVILSDFFIALTVCNTVVVNNAPRVDSIDEGYAEDGCFISGNSMFYIIKEDFEREEKRASEEKSRKQWTQEAIAIKGGEKGCSEAASKYDVKVPEVLLSVSSSSYATQITVQIEDDIERSTVRKISSRNSFGIRTSKLQSRLSSLNNSVSSFGKRFFNGAHRRKMKFQMMRQPEKTMYEAESPDELALVYGAKAYGFFLLRRSVDDITVLDPYSNQRIFKIYNVFPFDSHRKRMSIIVRDEIGIVLYCKGADNEIFNALSPSFCHSAEGGRIIKLSRQHLEEFSSQGLRTLCVAMKRLTPFSYEVWNARHTAIEKDENMKGKDERLRRSIAQMENDLSLIGVTAIEDRLQDGVAETLSDLRRAGIQVWLLTGDKRETALNIARSCNLFPPECTVVNVSDESDVDAIKDLDDDEICLTLCEKGVELLKKPESSLVEAMKRIRSVLCYRMSPATKADVVRVVKKSLKGKVLAIGDGANDVSMIQCADVGIGISGQEGLQAVMASDFAIARFRFLRKLLLVHGHWCYDRLARVLLYFFYKNAAFVFVAFWVQIYNGFSVAPALDELYMMSYSVIFTGVQPIVFGVFEQITNKECLLNDPFLYYVGREGQLYGRFYFWLNMLDALYQSVVIYFFTFLAFWDTNYSYHMFGFFLASSIFVCNNFHLAIETHHWTLGTVMVFMIFFVVHYVFFIIEDLVASPSWEFKDTPALVALRYSSCMLLSTESILHRYFVPQSSIGCKLHEHIRDSTTSEFYNFINCLFTSFTSTVTRVMINCVHWVTANLSNGSFDRDQITSQTFHLSISIPIYFFFIVIDLIQ